MSEISDLFARDPLSLTKDDRAKIIAHYRASRAQWNATGKSPRKKVEKANSPIEKLTLDDVGEL